MKRVINQERMRTTNKGLIMEYIRDNGPVSKSEIALHLGLSATTVSTFINELQSEDKLNSCGNAKSTGGRKSALYQVNPEAFYVIGLDLQVDRIIAVLLNFQGKLVDINEYRLTSTNEWTVIEQIKEIISEIIQRNDLDQQKINGIGIGVPGIVQNQNGLIEFAPNLGWKNVSLQQLLSLDWPVYIENEANAAVLGETAFGVAKNTSDVVYVSVGMGVGCGLIIGGHLFTGRSFHAGEFGHMSVEINGRPCRCGNTGCWEVYTSNQAALAYYAEHSGEHLESYDALLELFYQGDNKAQEVMNSIIKYLGIGIANIANGLNPEMIVIGGKITEAKDIVFNHLLKQVKESCLDKTFGGLAIEFSQLQNRSTALGVADMAIRRTMII